jgi:lipopolysaccharide/colanic/teichoic acid biosynthesis glycosyltransferase
MFDVVFSLGVIGVILWWLMPLLCIAIAIESKGWPLFFQKRTGYAGKTFWCLKMRSMRVNREADQRQATDTDDRITRLGRFIRRTNIDELPQFFNVLFGQMSVVGPRPHMLAHTQYYSVLIDRYMDRHTVKPGLTGLAQVNGYHGETSQLWKMRRRVELDLHYVEEWSFWMDIKIVWQTVCCRWKQAPVEYVEWNRVTS